MDLQILISIDGESLALNDELNATIGDIVNSYIKQKISGVIKKEKKVKDPNAPKRPPRPHLTDEEKENVFNLAKPMQDYTKSKLAKIIANQINRPVTTMYSLLLKFEKEGRLKFGEFDRKNFMVEQNASKGVRSSVDAFKQAFGKK